MSITEDELQEMFYSTAKSKPDTQSKKVSQREAVRKYRQRNPDKARKSSDKSASKRFVKSASIHELEELLGMIQCTLKQLKEEEQQWKDG